MKILELAKQVRNLVGNIHAILEDYDRSLDEDGKTATWRKDITPDQKLDTQKWHLCWALRYLKEEGWQNLKQAKKALTEAFKELRSYKEAFKSDPEAKKWYDRCYKNRRYLIQTFGKDWYKADIAEAGKRMGERLGDPHWFE